MKFIATTSDKVNDIAKIKGQLIFSQDDQIMYLDINASTRIKYKAVTDAEKISWDSKASQTSVDELADLVGSLNDALEETLDGTDGEIR